MNYSLSMDAETVVLQIISSIANREAAQSVTPDSRLKHDLGFDSLTTLEMCVEIESALKVSIEDKIGSLKTVGDIISLIENNVISDSDVEYNIDDYPLPKTKKHIKQLKHFMRLSRFTWYFKVSGLSNLPTDGKYILCPNHQSHFDSLWVWTAIGKKRGVDLNKICCLAKQEHLKSNSTRFMLTLLGGIPVDRSGNTVPAMKRALECIQDGYTMLIHPEGTRTKDGKIHEFKGGAAKLALDAGVPLIPVRIEGAWNIFPPHRKTPRIFGLKGSYSLTITFGKPITPNNRTVEDLTSQLQTEVENLG